MREIKFRCWRGGYMCSYYPQWRFVENGLYWEEKNADPDFIDETKLPILLQYTGLKDKNGVEIYEGDIVRVGKFNYKPSVIIWKDGAFGYDNPAGFYQFPAYKDTEVIGNIYENPELLR